ncbi:MAG: heme-degrading domain-containing protein [Devosia sp.]
MAKDDDIRLIVEQEKTLVFPAFSEDIAFEVGTRLRQLGLERRLGIAIEIKAGERPLFYSALAGSTADNANWLRRKANLVQRVSKASYRAVLEYSEPQNYFSPRRGLDNADYVLAGGGFPIWVKNAGMIGAVCVSGLHERDDHGLVVEALCAHLKQDARALMLPPP